MNFYKYAINILLRLEFICTKRRKNKAVYEWFLTKYVINAIIKCLRLADTKRQFRRPMLASV